MRVLGDQDVIAPHPNDIALANGRRIAGCDPILGQVAGSDCPLELVMLAVRSVVDRAGLRVCVYADADVVAKHLRAMVEELLSGAPHPTRAQ